VYVWISDEDPGVILDEDGPTAYRVFQLRCPTTAARPPVAVEGATLPQTGGFTLALPLLGLALLAGGAGMVAASGRRPGAN